MSLSASALREYEKPTCNLVTPLLTDLYEITMTYAYWKGNRYNEPAVFDLFFRKNPFKGEYCVFAGLDECLKFISTFRFSPSDIEYLKKVMPHAEPEFFVWLSTLDCRNTKVYAMKQGSAVFPREPLIRVEGPLAVGQLLETTLLNLVNFSSLLCTNAARMKRCAGPGKTLLEFGLRRAQGPDGGVSASKYAIIGGFDGTSNVLAGKLFDLNVRGTHAHAFVMCHRGFIDVKSSTIKNPNGAEVEFVSVVQTKLKDVIRVFGDHVNSREGELAAFCAYAQSFPSGFIGLVDTYDTLRSGIPNFMAVALALNSVGYKAVGIRLDSGDLGELSKSVRRMFIEADNALNMTIFTKAMISASDDINENKLLELNKQGHEIDSFGIGTHLVTCQKQPALGGVYKLVQINGEPRIKMSEDVGKTVTPCCKTVFRFYGENDIPICDYIQESTSPACVAGVTYHGRQLIDGQAIEETVTPFKTEELVSLVWDGPNGLIGEIPTVATSKRLCEEQLNKLTVHTDPLSPIPYKVLLGDSLYAVMADLMAKHGKA